MNSVGWDLDFDKAVTDLQAGSDRLLRGIEQLYAQQAVWIERGTTMQCVGVQIDKRFLCRNGLITRPDGSCLLYTSPSPRDKRQSRMPSSA